MIVNMRDLAYIKFKIKHDQKEAMRYIINSGIRDLTTLDKDMFDDDDKKALELAKKLLAGLDQ